jgi:hypothetical protein
MSFTLILNFLLICIKIVERTVAIEILNVYFAFLHVVEVEPFGIGGGNKHLILS